MALLRLDAEEGSGTGKLPKFFFTLVPIWDNPILWVFGYDSQRELIAAIREALRTDPLMADAVLTRNPRDLVNRPDELVILLPTDAAQEVLTVATVIVFGERIFGGRTAPCVLLFENGGSGQQLLELALKLRLWGPR